MYNTSRFTQERYTKWIMFQYFTWVFSLHDISFDNLIPWMAPFTDMVQPQSHYTQLITFLFKFGMNYLSIPNPQVCNRAILVI